MTTVRRLFRGSIFTLIAAAAACYSKRAQPTASELGWSCTGVRYVEVTNPTRIEVEVYAYLSDGTSIPNTLVGMAQPGVSRLSLADANAAKAHGFTARSGGRYVREVKFRRGCESAE
jgi:hypothetical protein